MKPYLRLSAVLAALVLLFSAAALAADGEQDLLAPFQTEAGPITIQAVFPASETEPLTEIALSIPEALLDGTGQQSEYMQSMFLLMSLNGIYHPDHVTGWDITDGYYKYSVYFALPEGSDLADYRLVYGDQLRMLARTSAEAALLMEQADE